MPCPKCGNVDARLVRDCKPCKNALARRYRKTHRISETQRWKDSVRSYAGQYLKRGKIDRWPCSVCGEPAEMHHEDYTKPLDVRWFCREHHLQMHQIRKALLEVAVKEEKDKRAR